MPSQVSKVLIVPQSYTALGDRLSGLSGRSLLLIDALIWTEATESTPIENKSVFSDITSWVYRL